MRSASFRVQGRPTWGVLEGTQILDLQAATGIPDLKSALCEPSLLEIDAGAIGAPGYDLAGIEWLPPIPNPGKIFCVGINYADHAVEADRPVSPAPSLFLRTASTLAAHETALILPHMSSQLDYEGELAVVIGRPGRHIPESEALGHVAGYTCFNDGSLRDVQFGHSPTAGKNFFATGGVGPWITSADEVPDPQNLLLTTRVNGVEMQRASTADMIFGVAGLIAYCSRLQPLETGDIIVTGTPAGVGFSRQPPLWLKPGDVVEVEIQGIATLRNRVSKESNDRSATTELRI